MNAETIKDQLVGLVVKYKNCGLCFSEYRRMIRKAAILASAIGMDMDELLDEMLATY